MGMVCAVTFSRHGRLYYADPGELSPQIGDRVLYPTDDGPEVAEVMWAAEWVSDEMVGLPVLEGMADERSLADSAATRKRKAVARVAARRLIRDLGATLKGRVELRQLSARDQAKLSGGVGSCGRELCCSTFLVDFEPVSVRMAKDQDLPPNPMRISGACGRLMCCLKYEHPLYADFAAKAPAVGEQVDTPDGAGSVVGHNVPSESVVVKLTADGRRTTCALASVCGSRKAYEQRADTDAPPDGAPTGGGCG